METKTNKTKVEIDITLDKENKTCCVETVFDGDTYSIMTGLLEALSDVFIKSVKVPVEDGINELCELLSKEIREKAAEKQCEKLC